MSHHQTASIEAQRTQVRIELAAMFRLTHMYGWDDTVWNHITARVPGSDNHFYMHQFGLMYDEVTASNLIVVDAQGNVIDGPNDVNTTAIVIHGAIHMSEYQHNNRFVFHTHPRSCLGATALQELPFLVQDSAVHFNKIGYHDWEGISVDPDERHRLAKNLGDNSCLVMRNHGLLTVGSSAGECFMNMYYLIRTCEAALQALATGSPLAPTEPATWQLAAQQYEHFPPGKYEWPALLRKLDRIDSSYKS